MSGIGVNLRVTGHCNQGGRKYMEDMFSVAYQQTVDLKDLEYAFFGIFDGHGGPQAATFAKEHLLDYIVNQRNFWSNDDEDVLRAIRDGYLATHYAMWKDLDKWPKTTSGLPSTSGSTATVAFIMRGKIYIGHVGDTAIVLGYQEDGMREWKAKILTRDHKPENKEEKHRIEQSGGKVVNKSGVPRVVWNRPRLGHQGPVRRSTPIDEIPFLAVARSLGDFWSYNSALDQFVVSPEPDVLVYPVDVLSFRCLVLGTDGLWNTMTADRAVTLVQATEIHNEKQVIYGLNNQYNKDWLNPSKALVDRALERWLTTKLRADNTSVVTLLLDPPGPPRAQVLLKQINSWRGESALPEGETKVTVPKSGGLAIFTHYPFYEAATQTGLKDKPTSEISGEKDEQTLKCVNKLPSKNDKSFNSVVSTDLSHGFGFKKLAVAESVSEDCGSSFRHTCNIPTRSSGVEKEEKALKCVNKLPSKNNKAFNSIMSSDFLIHGFGIKKLAEAESVSEDCGSSFRHTCNIPTRSRSEEKKYVEEISSDAENERVFPDCDPKKRRLSLEKKSNKPGTRRRPSLPALSGKCGNLCKSKSLEESTRMLRSATPIKTLRSRNIDLSVTGSVKRGRALSPLVGKKQRIDDQCSSSPLLGKRKSPSKIIDTDSAKSSFLKSFLEHENNSQLYYDDKRDDHDVSLFTKKLLRERKLKSMTPSLLSQRKLSSDDGKSQSMSDSELPSMLSSFASHSRKCRVEDYCPKRKLKVATTTTRSTSESILVSTKDT